MLLQESVNGSAGAVDVKTTPCVHPLVLLQQRRDTWELFASRGGKLQQPV